MPAIPKRVVVWSALPGVVLLNFVIPFILSVFSPHLGWNNGPSSLNLSGLIFFVPGLGLFVTALRAQLRSLRNVSALDVASPARLIEDGPYRFSRNPMVLGASMTWAGWVIVFGSVLALGGLAALIAVMQLIEIPWEERNLEKQFGDVYRSYKKAVPRWIGRRRERR